MSEDPIRLGDVDWEGTPDAAAMGRELASLLRRDVDVARRSPHEDGSGRGPYDVEAGLARFAALTASIAASAAIQAAGSAASTGAAGSTGAGGSTGAAVSTSGGAPSGLTSSGAVQGGGVLQGVGALQSVGAVKLVGAVLLVVAGGLGAARTLGWIGDGDGAHGVMSSATIPREASTPTKGAGVPAPSSASSVDEASRTSPPPTKEAVAAEAREKTSSPRPSETPTTPRPAVSASGAAGAHAQASADARSSDEGDAARAEMAQLARVRAAADPSSRLALADEGQASFPAGLFWQEREHLAIEALSALGRAGEARTRARAFVARFPKSPYATALRSVAEPADVEPTDGPTP